MPTCPKCVQTFHRGAESSCPHCGFLFAAAVQKAGVRPFLLRRVNDEAGVLRHVDRVKLAQYLEKIERRIRPAALSVYFPNITEPFILKQHSFAVFNQAVVQQADFSKNSEHVDPEWLFMLVIDIRTATAHFIWGYQLDPYVDIDRISGAILKARLLLRDGLLVPGIRKVMKEAVRQIVKRSRTVAAHPEKYALKTQPALSAAPKVEDGGEPNA